MKRGLKNLVFLVVFGLMFVSLVGIVSAECPIDMISYWKFDETSGATAGDSANGNPGTVGSSVVWTTGQVNGALRFDGVTFGTGKYVEIAGSSTGNLDIYGASGSITISAWVKTNTFTYGSIVSKREWPPGGQYLFDIYNNNLRLVWYDPGSASWPGARCNITSYMSTGSWYHVAGTYDAGSNEVAVYVDGNKISACSVIEPTGMTHYDVTTKIGAWADGGTSRETFNGSIDEVAIFNRTLSEDEISLIYEKSLAGKDYCYSECSLGETSCAGTNYLTCDNGWSWTNNGEIEEECGVHSCSSPNDIIMKLYSPSNSHGALWNDIDYSYDICCQDIFGAGNSACLLANPHDCNGAGAIPDNKVLGLYSSNNSHAEIPSLDYYAVDVCYGDLVCEAKTDPDPCPTDYEVVARLYQENNSHISNASDINYPIKICCKSGAALAVPEAYWANMMGTPINTVDKNADVKLIVKDERFSEKQVNFTIYESGGTIRKILSFITFGLISRDIFTGEITGFGEATWVTEPGDMYYFIATLADDASTESDSSLTGGAYGYLNVSDTEINYPISVDIIYPSINLEKEDRRFKIEKEIPFELKINSPDDDVQIRWDFGDGNITEKTNCLTVNEEACKVSNHSYSNRGTKTVYLTAKEMRRNQEANNYTIVFIYDEGINVFAIINEPKPDWVFGTGIRRINFNASESYVANCTTGSCPTTLPAEANCYLNPIEDLYCFDYPKTGADGIGSKYGLWFGWSFSEGVGRYGNWTNNYPEVVDFSKLFIAPTKHWANLKVGYEVY